MGAGGTRFMNNVKKKTRPAKTNVGSVGFIILFVEVRRELGASLLYDRIEALLPVLSGVV